MAGLISQAFIDGLLSRINIVDVIDKRLPLKKTGRSYMACCPFHNEKSPSFSVSQEKQFFHCFGCGANGNAIGFLMLYEGLDFPSAVESLAGSIGLEVAREDGSFQANSLNEKQKELALLLKQAASFYQACLLSTPRGADYLSARGLSPSVIEDFCIGYAPASWDALMKTLLSAGWSEKALVESGMLVQKEGVGGCYDRFRDRVVFPIRDVKGRYIAFGGRVLANEKPKYLNSPETALFSKGRELYGLYEANQKSKGRLDRLVVVEGYMDVVTLAQFGIKNAVATLGTAIGSSQIEKGFRYCDELVFCFDGDEAGRRAAVKALHASLPMLVAGKSVKFLFLPEHEDPDSYLRSRGSEAFMTQLELAQPVSVYLFERIQEGLLLDTPEGRSSLIMRALPELCLIPEGIYRKQLFMELALRSQSDTDFLESLAASMLVRDVAAGDVTDLVNSSRFTTSNTQNAVLDDGEKAPRVVAATLSERSAEVLQVVAAEILLGFPEWSDFVLAELDVCMVQQEPKDRFWLVKLAELIKQNPGASPSRLLGVWYASYGDSEYAGTLAELLAKNTAISDPQAALIELQDVLAKLIGLWNREMPLDQLIAISKQRALTGCEKERLRYLLVGPAK